MRLAELNAISRRGKAGFIPYVLDGEKLLLLFMTASDPAYGGSKPMIAKGRIDPGESPAEAAVREAEEELGLKRSNLKRAPVIGWEGELTGLDEKYTMTVYTAEVNDRTDFNEPHYETGDTFWLTPEEFVAKGRTSQRHIVAEVVRTINRK